jgi:hypothetical protein
MPILLQMLIAIEALYKYNIQCCMIGGEKYMVLKHIIMSYIRVNSENSRIYITTQVSNRLLLEIG